MLTYLRKGEKFRFSTGLKIKDKGWRGNRAKPQYPGSVEINSLLDSYEETIKEIEREAIFLKRDYSINVIKRKFESKIGRLSPENEFFKAYEIFITQNRPTKSPTTIKAYIGTKNKLQEFQEKKRLEVTFEVINNSFYEKFVDFLIEEKYLNNTIGKHVKTLKTFINYCKDQEICNSQINVKKFKVLQEEVDIVYLTDQELQKIFNLKDLSERLARVRDCFCFGCFTGLRFSDIDSLQHSNIKNDFIELRTHKTKELLKIPLNGYAKEILTRYCEHDKPLPTGLSNQKVNDSLKDLAELAEINEPIERDNYCGSTRVHFSQPKYELITTHTARRTFVTLALEKGIRAEVVMAMTGHKSYRTFKKYIKITDKIMQSEMIRLWNKPLLKVV